MICILIGYKKSQCIVPASKYLAAKYLPAFFKIIYLNYEGEINGWSKYLSDYLQTLNDELIIFALDDYLLADKIDMEIYGQALLEMKGDVVCAKLCHASKEENLEYPITTQYCIWNREFLIWLLSQVNNAWEFEIRGSLLFKTIGKKVIFRPCLNYFTNSSISGRWEGIRLDGLKDEDIKYIKENGLI